MSDRFRPRRRLGRPVPEGNGPERSAPTVAGPGPDSVTTTPATQGPADGDASGMPDASAMPEASVGVPAGGDVTATGTPPGLLDSNGTPQTHDDDDDAPRLSGYRVTGRLGEGGMGVVWRAVQLSTKRQVALKLMGPRLFVNPAARLRFQREVELHARLDHRNVAQVYESGVDQGVYFYAMELVEGVPLDKYVADHHLDRRGILQLFQLVCEGVQHAHQRGVIHRDLKPINILVTSAGVPKVLDFGLAKLLQKDGDGEDNRLVTRAGDVAGTLPYMSPQQAAGEPIDTRTDVYALGVILYRLLTGKPPHDLSGPDDVVLRRIRLDEVSRPRAADATLDRELEAVLLKALARDPDRRYPSAGALAADLGHYLRGEPLTARPPTLTYFLGKRLRRHRALATAVATVLALLATMAVVSYLQVAAALSRTVVARDEALAPQHAARLLLAQGLVDQGDAAVAAGRPADARLKYGAARALVVQEKASTLRADLGFWNVDRLFPPPLVAHPALGRDVVAVAVAADGRTAVTGKANGQVEMVDLVVGRASPLAGGHRACVWTVAIAPDGGSAITGDDEGRILFWDLTSGGPPRAFDATGDAAAGPVTLIVRSPDGRLALSVSGSVASITGDPEVTLWDVAKGRPVRRLPAEGRVTAAAFAGDGATVLTGGERMTLWRTADGERAQDFPGPPGQLAQVSALAFSDDGRSALAGRSDGVVARWRVDPGGSGPPHLEWWSRAHAVPVCAVGFAAGPLGPTVAAAAQDQTVAVCDGATGEVQRRHGEPRARRAPTVAVSDGGRFAVGAADGALTVHHLAARPEVRPLSASAEPIASAAFVGAGSVVTHGSDGLTVRDAATGAAVVTLPWPTEAVAGAAVAPDGRTVALVGGGALELWDVDPPGKKPVWSVPIGPRTSGSLAFSPDGTSVLLATNANGLSLRSAANGAVIRTFVGNHAGTITSLAFSADGTRAVSGSRDRTVRVWDVATGTSLPPFKGHDDAVYAVALSADGRTAVSAGGRAPGEAGADDFAVRLWDTTGAVPVRTLAGHGVRVRAVAVSPDGRLVASADDHGVVKLWDPVDGRELRSLAEHKGSVHALAFAPDGQSFVTAGQDQVPLLWDLSATRRRQALSPTFDAAIRTLRTTPGDAASLASGGDWYAFHRAMEWAEDARGRVRP